MESAFQPKGPDGLARRVIVENLIAGRPHGELVTYDELGGELGLDPEHERTKIQVAVRAALRALRGYHKRTLTAAPLEGYRILLPVEHDEQAQGFRSQSARRMQTALAVLEATDLDALDVKQRLRNQAQTELWRGAIGFMAELDRRTTRVEDAMRRAGFL